MTDTTPPTDQQLDSIRANHMARFLPMHDERGQLLAEVDRLRAELAAARHVAFHQAANLLDDIAAKQDLFDDDKGHTDAEHTRSSARALRIYIDAVTAAGPTT